jgi:hypothetical protein
MQKLRSQNRVAGIASGCGLNDRGQSWSPTAVKNFLFSTSSRLTLGPTQPPIQWIMKILSLGVKWPRHEADHSSPVSAKVKKTWIY